MALPERNPTQTDSAEKRSVGRGIFKKCAGCGHVLTAPSSQHVFTCAPRAVITNRMSVAEWKLMLLDDGAFEAWDDHIVPADPLLFVDDKPYPERVAKAPETYGCDGGDSSWTRQARRFGRRDRASSISPSWVAAWAPWSASA